MYFFTYFVIYNINILNIPVLDVVLQRLIWWCLYYLYRGADKFLVRPGRKQARKHIRDARDFNNIETRSVIKFFFLQGKAQKETHAILTEALACFLPGRAKDLSAPHAFVNSLKLASQCRNMQLFSKILYSLYDVCICDQYK